MAIRSRRFLLKGAAGAAGLAAFGALPGGRQIRAQSAAYDIVDFGPVADGVRPVGAFRLDPGAVSGIHANGTAYGRLAASEEKFFPVLYNADGQLTKLKSGTFGGTVAGINGAGMAVGAAFENPGGRSADGDRGQRPAAWIDGELVRLELPSGKRFESSQLGGEARSVSDDGVILGSANGFDVLWIDGAVQELPTGPDVTSLFFYSRISPNGSIVGRVTRYNSDRDDEIEHGAINGLELTPFDIGEFGAIYSALNGINSTNEGLFTATPTDLPYSVIGGAGIDPITIDLRAQGVSFLPSGFNSDHDIVGTWRPRQDLDAEPALWRAGEITPLADLLPAGHGLNGMLTAGISDDGIIAASGWDADGGFHPLLFVPI